MGLPALCVATLMYAIAAVDLLRLGNVLMAVVWASYATANAALMRASYPKEIDALIRQWL